MSARVDATEQRGQPRIGFTLIELMVVVAILAILISILVPSLAGAREQARIIKCASQLRQLGAANTYYVADQGGWVPGDFGFGFTPGAEPPHVLFAEVLLPYLDAGQGKQLGEQWTTRFGSRECQRLQVFAKTALLQCPSWPGVTAPVGSPCPAGGNTGSRRRGGGGTSSPNATPRFIEINDQVLCYVVNAWDFVTEKAQLGPDGFTRLPDGPEPPRGLVRVEQIPRPGSMIFMTEANRDNIGVTSFTFHDMWQRSHLWDSIDSRMVDDLRHTSGKGTSVERARTNNLYFDGHAATVRLADITAHDFSPYQPPSPNAAGQRRR